ncbi:MAG: type III-B CRISPR module-associated protein Cmr3 [Chloroflexi bacterium]|nr:type III-B CRISPR module-associated protein Cmr3 [Chloroflexota bacterium]
MTHWIIMPRDPLIFRDGRPFTADPGAQASSLPFPLPATIAGAVRTMTGTDQATGVFDSGRIPELLRKNLRGPLLVELNDQGLVGDLLLPAPSDALIIKSDHDGEIKRLWLQPLATGGDEHVNLDHLAVTGPAQSFKGKAYPSSPRYWRWEQYEKWLSCPQNETIDNLSVLGINGPTTQNRIHTSIAHGTQTGIPGALFQTNGLEFIHNADEPELTDLANASNLALVVETDAQFPNGLGYLGGEHRIVNWKTSTHGYPICPATLRDQIKKAKACRVILLTAAFFENGYLPQYILNTHKAKLKAAIVRRYQTVSGWDYAYSNGRQKGRPKPTRRLAPSGSVYYIKLDDNLTDLEIDAFINAIWMQNISDDEQSRFDGFGLAVLGYWDGEFSEMEEIS